MRYVLLLYASEAESRRASASEAEAVERERRALAAALAQSGKHGASHALVDSASATTLRRRGGRTVLCDGPCEETREQLRGLLLVEARDLDEAIAIAERTPDARLGSVEIRPVRESL
ncbi:MAG TPA: YciI family protein [Myxococcota bacterium]|nr:YciI family protein [Myxococcota bacterium]